MTEQDDGRVEGFRSGADEDAAYDAGRLDGYRAGLEAALTLLDSFADALRIDGEVLAAERVELVLRAIEDLLPEQIEEPDAIRESPEVAELVRAASAVAASADRVATPEYEDITEVNEAALDALRAALAAVEKEIG